jgi:hypothetical protein
MDDSIGGYVLGPGEGVSGDSSVKANANSTGGALTVVRRCMSINTTTSAST